VFKVIIAGSRGFNNYDLLKSKCDQYFQNLNKAEIEIVCGGATGADNLGLEYAKEKNIKFSEHPANWNDLSEPCVIKYTSKGNKYNALAGFKRNEDMAKYSDALILFWDGKSPGSKDMLSLAKKYNLKYKVVLYNETK